VPDAIQTEQVQVWAAGNFLGGDFARFGDFEVIQLATDNNSDPFFARFCSQMENCGASSSPNL
jgi:hypothetical protein